GRHWLFRTAGERIVAPAQYHAAQSLCRPDELYPGGGAGADAPTARRRQCRWLAPRRAALRERGGGRAAKYRLIGELATANPFQDRCTALAGCSQLRHPRQDPQPVAAIPIWNDEHCDEGACDERLVDHGRWSA